MQFHANYEPKKFMSSFLTQHYKGRSVQILQGCCKKCLKHGKPTIYNLSTHPWSRLLDEGTIDPYQTASVFFPGSQFHSAHFKKPVLDLQAPELPCKYPATCEQTCLLCNGFIDGPGMAMKEWPGFKVHVQCTTRCQFTNCHTRLPDFPAYISYQRSQFVCEEHLQCKNLHGMSTGFQRMSIDTDGCGACTPQLISKARKDAPAKEQAKKEQEKMAKMAKMAKPTPLPEPKPLPKPEPKPLPKPALRTEEKRVEGEAVKKTVHFKKPPGRAKADKYGGDKSRAITDYFRLPAKPKPPTVEPRRFIRNKLGDIYAYWRGENAHCIKTDKILFKANFSSSVVSGRRVYAPKFDFTPPKHFFTPETPEDKAITDAPAEGE